MSNEAQFTIKAKQWLFHKIILHGVSKICQQDKNRNAAIYFVKEKFGTFLKFPNNYSTGQIALLIKRHEGLLETILPIPQNPTYTTSVAALQTLIQQAEQIIKIYNL